MNIDKRKLGYHRLPKFVWEIPAAAQFIGLPPVLLKTFPGLQVSSAWGISLAVSVLFFGWLSGAHVNPGVTLVMASGGKIKFSEVPAYLICQIIGMILGVLTASFFLTLRFNTSAATALVARPAEPRPSWDISWAEAAGIGLLALGIYLLASRPDIKPFAWLPIGGLLWFLAVILGSFSGGAFNPTRALVAYFMSGSTEDWRDYVPAYGLIPFVGVFVACLIAFLLKTDEAPS